MNKKLLSIILILVAATTNCIFAAQNSAQKSDEPKKDLFETLKDRLAERRAGMKEDDDSDQSSESWDDEPKVEQKSEPTKPEARVKESDKIGGNEMALRKAVLARLLGDRMPPMDHVSVVSKKDEPKETKPAEIKSTTVKPDVKSDVDATEEQEEDVPPALPPRPLRNVKPEAEQQEVIEPTIQPQEVEKQAPVTVEAEPVTAVDSAPTQEIAKPDTMPVLVQGNEYYKNQVRRLRKIVPEVFNETDSFEIFTGCNFTLDWMENISDEEDLKKELLPRFNQARLMTEILGFNQELQGNDFLVKSGLTDKEKKQIQLRALNTLLVAHSIDVLTLVTSLLPNRFFVENNKVLVKLHLASKYAIHQGFASWYSIVADEEFYKQNSYQVNRAFDLIDRSSELLDFVKECKDASNFALYKDELNRIISELRWLWLVIDNKKYQGICQDQKISLQYYYSCEIFIDVIKNCMKRVQDLINV